ncbi:FHA domain-containing protein [Streptomyces sp. NBRC 110611]|nr:FHA domain-containing protein [Streptomyces sp. NBRC 110611]
MVLHLHQVALRPPLAAHVRQLAEHLLLLRVHADHRLAVSLVLFDLLVDVAELGVPVRMLLALQRLGLGL